MIIKGRMAAKEQGLYNSAEEDIAKREAKLQQQLEEGEITIEECSMEQEILAENSRKLAETIAKSHPDPAGEPEDSPRPKPFKKRKNKKNFWEENDK